MSRKKLLASEYDPDWYIVLNYKLLTQICKLVGVSVNDLANADTTSEAQTRIVDFLHRAVVNYTGQLIRRRNKRRANKKK